MFGLRLGRLGGVKAGAGVKPLVSPSTLFAGGEQGFWFDPSDFSTMFQDSAGTTPVTAVGQTVGKILDKSGNDNHATQATAASRPVLRQNVAGKYCLEPDGVDDWLTIGNSDFSAINKVSIFAGAAVNGTGVWKTLYQHAASSAFNEPSFGLQAPAGSAALQSLSYAVGTPSLLSLGGGTSDANIPKVLVAQMDRSIAVRSAVNRIDGVEVASANWAVGGNYGNLPGRISSIGGDAFAGKLYQLIVLGRLPTAQELTNTEAWIADKTGVVL